MDVLEEQSFYILISLRGASASANILFFSSQTTKTKREGEVREHLRFFAKKSEVLSVPYFFSAAD